MTRERGAVRRRGIRRPSAQVVVRGRAPQRSLSGGPAAADRTRPVAEDQVIRRRYGGAVKATDLAAEELVTFVGRYAPEGPVRLLEVGCGQGELAEALNGRGYDVLAVDRDAQAVAATRERGVKADQQDFLEYQGGPFETVVFSRTLHELGDVDGGLTRTEAVLADGGVVVVDEFARDWADASTAGFFYDVCYLLAASGVLEPPGGPEDEAPLVRWEREYGRRKANPRAGAGEILARVRERFDILAVEECPYLYRHIGQWLDDGEAGSAVLRRLRAVEGRRLARGELRPMGMRVAARVRAST